MLQAQGVWRGCEQGVGELLHQASQGMPGWWRQAGNGSGTPCRVVDPSPSPLPPPAVWCSSTCRTLCALRLSSCSPPSRFHSSRLPDALPAASSDGAAGDRTRWLIAGPPPRARDRRLAPVAKSCSSTWPDSLRGSAWRQGAEWLCACKMCGDQGGRVAVCRFGAARCW